MTPDERARSVVSSWDRDCRCFPGFRCPRCLIADQIRAAEAEAYERGIAEEREACARECDRLSGAIPPDSLVNAGMLDLAAAAIRARGEK